MKAAAILVWLGDTTLLNDFFKMKFFEIDISVSFMDKLDYKKCLQEEIIIFMKIGRIYSHPPIYQAPIYLVPRFTGPHSFPRKFILFRPQMALPRFTGSPDLPCIFVFPRKAW